MLRIVFLSALIAVSTFSYSQFTVSGKVTDEQGKPLTGATVSLYGANQGVVAGIDGTYRLSSLPAGNHEIVAMFIGFASKSIELNLRSDTILDFKLHTTTVYAEEVIVTATRAGNNTPIAHVNVGKEEIQLKNLGQDLPYLLSTTPSMVVTSDAGTGVGYTGFRIRGTDANRINITVNGIPMNDAESHGVWWVNMPDISSSIDNIQVQRGVGTSTNGAGAFGASINMQTDVLSQESYASISSSAGSFNTFKNSVKIGTGLLKNHFAFDARLSKISSDGFIDRAASDLKSFYFSGGYYSANTIVKANIFSGREETYQAWNGIPKVRLNNDVEGMLRYQDHWLYTPDETQHMLNSDSRTYNYYTYENETDNYQQDHYQIFLVQRFTSNLTFNAALHYTYGRGYYEQYRTDDELADYNLPDIITGFDTITNTDLVRQKWLENDFYGTTFSLNYKKGMFDAVIGGAWNKYDGLHFGNIIWAQYLGEVEKDYEWYRNTGIKTDFNLYSRTNFALSEKINLFADVQYRGIQHTISGIDDDYRDISQEHHFDFINPKIGIFVKPAPSHETYLSFAMAHREPNRTNFTDAANTDNLPVAERLSDLELGYKAKSGMFTAGANAYYMSYKDQLVLTGQINDVGSALMVNVDKSYRLGLELFAAAQLSNKLKWEVNTTLSRNKILNFTEYVDNWDTWGQEVFNYEQTDIAFSPNLTGASILCITPVKQFDLVLTSQYVSKQYIDNSMSADRMLDSYFVNNLALSYTIEGEKIESICFRFQVYNLFNEQYESNAWVYSYLLGSERYEMDGYFTQAGINFLSGIEIKF